MNAYPGLRLLTRNEIDAAKWDQCVATALNGLIYARTWYLDALCNHWSALVLNDYEAVMPLPWRRKWGFTYVYTPYYITSLGIFSRIDLSEATNHFLKRVCQHFCYCNLDTDLPGSLALPPHWQQTMRVNQMLEPGMQQYSRLAKRKLAEAARQEIRIDASAKPEQIIRLYQQEYHTAHAKISADIYDRLITACNVAPANCITTLVAHLPHAPFAGFYLLLSDDRYVYSLLGGSTPEGKKAGAFYALTDAALQIAAAAGKTFRFEGSDIPGIAFFNQQFGAKATSYLQLRMNRLPFPLRWLKK